MFQALEPLLRSAEKLVLSLTMDGDNVVVFLTPAGGKDAVLRQPLILKATAAELDEGFAAAIGSFTAAHQSLGEQVQATNAILEAQQQTQVKKAQKALSKSSTPAAAQAATADDADGADDEDGEGAAATSAASTPSLAAAEQKPAGTDLSSLLL
ncbi:PRTRC system protein E [Burkholderia cepacia]|uniref:PRTRC system protein E n=1 Tax=Burkholderia cepacia TaxID=292 RepID=UPI00157A6BAB|nr:PRTRC system protein E [Burkholderia cepacia]MCA7894569.1 PRTRC system protein E [Burkholderia cepacia]MDN7913193.1 PRTRC system protein E [Burkholderia cepacia]NTX47692.1 PRTRC system protein E [Burkholderia cepacia]HEM7888254.1 PRTRC system protein E [Burkholderia cepacia]HEM8508539.1 PRTRC system protein E [Burkholderia cepacia]